MLNLHAEDQGYVEFVQGGRSDKKGVFISTNESQNKNHAMKKIIHINVKRAIWLSFFIEYQFL